MNSSTENSGLNVNTRWRVDEAYARGVTAIGKEVCCSRDVSKKGRMQNDESLFKPQ